MIKSQLNVHGQEDEEKLQILYANMVAMPRVAYLRQDGFVREFHDNALIGGLMREALCKCVYVEPYGTPTEMSPISIRQEDLRPCRQMVRYIRGFRLVTSEARQPPEEKLQLNLAEAQRDVLKARGGIIERDDQLYQDKCEESGRS